MKLVQVLDVKSPDGVGINAFADLKIKEQDGFALPTDLVVNQRGSDFQINRSFTTPSHIAYFRIWGKAPHALDYFRAHPVATLVFVSASTSFQQEMEVYFLIGG